LQNADSHHSNCPVSLSANEPVSVAVPPERFSQSFSAVSQDDMESVTSSAPRQTFEFPHILDNRLDIDKPSSRDWAGELVWGRDPSGRSSLEFLRNALKWVTSIATLDELIRNYNMRGDSDRRRQWLLDKETQKYVCWDPNRSSAKQKSEKARLLKRQSISVAFAITKKRKLCAAEALIDDQSLKGLLVNLLATQRINLNDEEIQKTIDLFNWIYEKGYTDNSRTYENFGEGGKYFYVYAIIDPM